MDLSCSPDTCSPEAAPVGDWRRRDGLERSRRQIPAKDDMAVLKTIERKTGFDDTDRLGLLACPRRGQPHCVL